MAKKNAARDLYHMISSTYFTGAVTLCIIVMLVLWWMPLLQVELGVAAFPNREGALLNILDVEAYLTMADALFILSFILTALGFAAMLTITVLILMKTAKDNADVTPTKCTGTLSFKTFVFVVLLLYFLFLAIAGLFHLACIDNAEMTRSAIVIKAFYETPAQLAEAKMIGQAIYQGSAGVLTAGSLLFLHTGLLIVQAQGVMSYADPSTYTNIKYQGMPLTQATVDKLATDGRRYIANAATGGGDFIVSNITGNFVPDVASRNSYPDVLKTNFTNAALTQADMADGSAFNSLLRRVYPNINAAVNMMLLYQSDVYLAGSALAYLTEMRHHLVKTMIFGGSPEIIDVDSVVADALFCETGIAFGAYVMVISFFVVAIFLLALIIAAWCHSDTDSIMNSMKGYKRIENMAESDSMLGGKSEKPQTLNPKWTQTGNGGNNFLF